MREEPRHGLRAGIDMALELHGVDVGGATGFGGDYRREIKHPAAPDPMAFYGKYIEVTLHSRLV